MISFEWWPIFFLFFLPWLAWRFMPESKNQTFGALKVPFFEALASLDKKQPITRTGLKKACLILPVTIWILLIMSAAKPMWLAEAVQLSFSGRELMLAVDISKSMEIEDLQLNGKQVDRLTVIKSVLNDFILKRAGDRLGLILFGSQAYLQAPLTFDYQTIRNFLNETPIGIAGSQTAIGDAIGLASKRLKDRPSNSKVLILLTDGANTSGTLTPLQAAQIAKTASLKIYTIAVGANEMTINSPFGGFFGSQKINPSADLDENTLKEVSNLTGGQYFRAENREKLEEIYSLIDKLEPVESAGKKARPRKTLFYYPLGLALFLTLLLLFSKLNMSQAIDLMRGKSL